MVIPKDILLVGSGAVGTFYAFVLKRSGLARITIVARSNYKLIEEEGIHFQSRKYRSITGWRPDRLCKSVAEAADCAYSYVIITTKSVPEVMKTSTILAPFFSPEYTSKFSQSAYIFVQNGLNVEVDTYYAVKALGQGEPRIVGCAVYVLTNLLAPNVVEHADLDRLILGVYRHEDFTTTENSPEEAALLKDLSDILEAGGTTISVVPEIQRHKFSKNILNLSFSSIATLTRYTVPSLFRPPPSDPLQFYTPYVCDTTAELISKYTIPNIAALLEEVVALGTSFYSHLKNGTAEWWMGRALGFPDTLEGLPSSVVQSIIEGQRILHIKPENNHVSSMLLDLRRGKPIEVEVIVGEVVRMAKAHNVLVPRVEMLYALLVVVQNQILRQLLVESK